MNYPNNNYTPFQAPPPPPLLPSVSSYSGGVLGANYSNLGANYSNLGANYSNLRGNYLNLGANYSNYGAIPYPNNGANPYVNSGSNWYPNNYYSNDWHPNINGYTNYQNMYRPQLRPNKGRQQQQRQAQPVQTPVNRSAATGRKRRRPTPLTMNDFLPSRLRQDSQMEIESTTTDVPIPLNALPQRRQQVTSNNNNNNNNRSNANTTQPFVVQEITSSHCRQTTTSSFRRRQRRNQQQQQQRNANNNNNNNNNYHSNRFAVLAEIDQEEGEDDTAEVVNNSPVIVKKEQKSNDKNKNNNNKKKTTIRPYLDIIQICNWFKDDVSIQRIIQSRGNKDFIIASAPIYDQWYRLDYESQVWQRYLQLGLEKKHWAKEVVRRTKKRDDYTNERFVKKKINQLSSQIAHLCASISDLQVKLGNYWSQTPKQLPRSVATTTTTIHSNSEYSADPINGEQIRPHVDNLEKCILKYIKEHTQHVFKAAENRVQLAKVEAEEYQTLEDFQQIATPAQWNVHLLMKPKMKTWSIKNKNYKTAVKRVEYNLPPKFINTLDFSYHIDESVINGQECQALYHKMRQLTSRYKTEAMTLYTESLARELEILSHEIDQIIAGFPSTDDNRNDDPALAAFMVYHNARLRRFNLEVEESFYFLDEERVVGKSNLQIQETIAPTHTRSVGTLSVSQI